MDSTDLIGIGRLGGSDNAGFFHLLIKPEYRDLLSELKQVFLIFNSDRVFYVTISDLKRTDKKIWVRFAEDGIKEERNLHKEAIVALAPEDIEEEDDELDSLIGSSVFYQNCLIGHLKSYFYNNAQYVLEIESIVEIELLVPYVDYYVSSAEAGKIDLLNADSILESQGLALVDGVLQTIEA